MENKKEKFNYNNSGIFKLNIQYHNSIDTFRSQVKEKLNRKWRPLLQEMENNNWDKTSIEDCKGKISCREDMIQRPFFHMNGYYDRQREIAEKEDNINSKMWNDNNQVLKMMEKEPSTNPLDYLGNLVSAGRDLYRAFNNNQNREQGV